MNATPIHRSRRTVIADVHGLGRCFLLLGLLMLLLLIGPLFPHGPGDEPPLPLRILDALVLVASVVALSTKRWTLIVAIILAVPALVTHFGSTHVRNGDDWLENLRIPSGILFNLFACGLIMTYAVRSGLHVRHRLAGAACAYLLLGFTFASGFALIDTLNGPALACFGQPAVPLAWNDIQYFSFCTLTTVGYGDFTPLTAAARTLATLETISGVLFVAVFISALVGEAAATRTAPPSS